MPRRLTISIRDRCIVMAGLVPAIHDLSTARKASMPGTRFTLGPAGGRTRVPGMTSVSLARSKRNMRSLMHGAVRHQRALELGAGEIGARQDGTGQARLREVGAFEIGAGEVG